MPSLLTLALLLASPSLEASAAPLFVLPESTLAELATAPAPLPPAIVNGVPTADYEAVGGLLVVDSSGYGGVICSGTLVDPSVAVTAAHCVQALDSDYVDFDAYFVIGEDLYASGGIVDHALVRSATANANFDTDSLQNDIGVLELDSAITRASPMPVNTDPLNDSWVGRSLTYVGYGVTSDDASDGGVRRTADLPIKSVDPVFVRSYDPNGLLNICSGDSGGAGLHDLGDGVYELTAVNSFVYSPNGDDTPCVGGGTGGTRVDHYIDWLGQFADLRTADGAVANQGDTTDSSGRDGGTKRAAAGNAAGGCASVPGPASGLGGLLLAAAGLRARRKRSPGGRTHLGDRRAR
jgi:secreted trypsin-like serine protease